MVKFVGRPVRSQLRAKKKQIQRDVSTKQIGWDDYNPGNLMSSHRDDKYRTYNK